MISDNILDVIGHTPLIRLNNMTDEDSAEILVKFEGLNVGGSIKTRTNPIGYLYGNLAVTVYVKAQSNGVVKNNRIDSILEQLQGIDGAVSEGFYFRLSPDNIIAPTYIDPSSNFSLTVINVEWHTV